MVNVQAPWFPQSVGPPVAILPLLLPVTEFMQVFMILSAQTYNFFNKFEIISFVVIDKDVIDI